MMFHSSHIHMPNRHRQRSALRTFFPSSSFSPPDAKEPLRRGILFSSVATVLLLVGAILTWLGFNDVFGGKISMTGPLLIALALLMLLLSLRQFMLARKRNRTSNGPLQMETMGTGGVTAVVVDHDDGNGAATIVVETWDDEEPNEEHRRTNYELAPPSYTDIAHSCSSNCPSFISHEDHNEAPPTYEETCGGELYHYNSESSLTNGGSRRCSSQLEGSLSSCRTSQQGQGIFLSETGSIRSSNTLCPRTNFSPGPFGRNQITGATVDACLPTVQPAIEMTANSNIAQCASPSDSGLDNNRVHSISLVQSGPAGPDSSIQSNDNTVKPPDWSRRSFSSIPSYTCLLSASGEVSAEVFDTTSYIEELMPTLEAEGKHKAPNSQDFLMGTSNIPTRSHSMSSMSTIRQGVPYNTCPPLHLNPLNPSPPGLPNQPVYDQQSACASLSVCNNSSTSQISKSPSFPSQASGLTRGSNSNPDDLLATQPSDGSGQVPIQPQPASSFSSIPKQEKIVNSQDISKQGGSRSPQGSSSLKLGPGPIESSGQRTLSQDSTSSQGKLLNTQDIQETI